MTAGALALILALVAQPGERLFVATLDGTQNVPPNPFVTATGTATFVLNAAQTELAFHIEYTGLSSDEIASHIHNADFKNNGPVAFTLPIGSVKDGVWQIPPAMVTELLAERLYVNVHSQTYSIGEIRGNITEAQVPVTPLSIGELKARHAPEETR